MQPVSEVTAIKLQYLTLWRIPGFRFSKANTQSLLRCRVFLRYYRLSHFQHTVLHIHAVLFSSYAYELIGEKTDNADSVATQ